MNPFSQNIIFYDTEFTHLDVRVGELMSVGLVTLEGYELYLELSYEGPLHPWVQKKVVPYLTGKKVSHEKARERLTDFLTLHSEKRAGKVRKPYLVSYVNQFDAIYWYKLFADPKKHPANWIPIDFASILFAYGFDPESMRKERFFKELEIDKTEYKQHNALDDARLLRETYLKLISQAAYAQ